MSVHIPSGPFAPDLSRWIKSSRRLPPEGEIVFVYDQERKAVYMAIMRIDAIWGHMWRSLDPLKYEFPISSNIAVAWMTKDRFLDRFRRVPR